MTHSSLKGLLIRRLGEEGVPTRSPIAVAELYRRLVPYPVCRDALGLATKAEYDIELLRLLADDKSVAVPEQGLREAVSRELASPEPGLAILQRFSASEVRLVEPEAASAAADGAPAPVAGRSIAAVAGPPQFAFETERLPQDRIRGQDDLEFVPVSPAQKGTPGAPEPGTAGEAVSDDACVSCGHRLPQRDGLKFCPNCGADQHRWPCRACGATVERGWRYCAMCGASQNG